MKVIATAQGYFHNPVTVERGAKTISACYIEPGDIFDIEKPGSWMKPMDGEDPPEPKPLTDKQEIMARLDELGVKYFKGASAEALAKLFPKE